MEDNKRLRVIVMKPGNIKGTEVYIDNELTELQSIVGGYIEAVPLIDNIYIIVNEEGKFKNYKPILLYGVDYLCGNVIFISSKNSDFYSLSDEEIQIINKYIELNKIVV